MFFIIFHWCSFQNYASYPRPGANWQNNEQHYGKKYVLSNTSTAERADSLDESEAIKAKESAEQELANKDATLDYAKASAQLAEAVARLKTIQKLRKKQ